MLSTKPKNAGAKPKGVIKKAKTLAKYTYYNKKGYSIEKYWLKYSYLKKGYKQAISTTSSSTIPDLDS